MIIEIWEDILLFEGLYKVSSLGIVKSFHYGREKVLSFRVSKEGYRSVSLWDKNINKVYRVNRLVAQAFIPNPDNKSFVKHINGIKDDNRVENLEWCTASENQLHSYRVLGNKIGFKIKHPMKGMYGYSHNRSKEITKMDMLGNVLKVYGSLLEASRSTGITFQNISKCTKGLRESAGGFTWKYTSYIQKEGGCIKMDIAIKQGEQKNCSGLYTITK